MYEPRRRHRGHNAHGLNSSKRSINIAFYTIHGLTIVFAIGLFLVAYLAQIEEKAVLGNIELNITYSSGIIYNICGGGLILVVMLGLSGHFLKGSSYWLLYCTIFSIIWLVQLSSSGISFSNMNNKKIVEDKLKSSMGDYGNSNKDERNVITEAWDLLQKRYKCCGVESYEDWQKVEFGLTSLRVPASCCLGKNFYRTDDKPRENCGQNMLPDHENASQYIFVKGCRKIVMERIDMQLFIMGVYSIIFSLFSIVVIVFSCFLVISKRI